MYVYRDYYQNAKGHYTNGKITILFSVLGGNVNIFSLRNIAGKTIIKVQIKITWFLVHM